LFDAAYREGVRADVPMLYTWKFIPPIAQPADIDHPRDRLVRRLRAEEKLDTAKDLDAPLKPIWTVRANYPVGVIDGPDQVQIRVDCIVDRFGRVQCAYFNEATSPELGWAAVTALSQWVFNRPKRQGEPVDVRIAVPVEVKRR
jgi:hypothetical protein